MADHFFIEMMEVSRQWDDIQSAEEEKTVNLKFFIQQTYPSEIKVIWKHSHINTVVSKHLNTEGLKYWRNFFMLKQSDPRQFELHKEIQSTSKHNYILKN